MSPRLYFYLVFICTFSVSLVLLPFHQPSLPLPISNFYFFLIFLPLFLPPVNSFYFLEHCMPKSALMRSQCAGVDCAANFMPFSSQLSGESSSFFMCWTRDVTGTGSVLPDGHLAWWRAHREEPIAVLCGYCELGPHCKGGESFYFGV